MGHVILITLAVVGALSIAFVVFLVVFGTIPPEHTTKYFGEE